MACRSSSQSSVEQPCVDGNGRIVREAKVASEPEALIAWFRKLGIPLSRIGLEAGSCDNEYRPTCADEYWSTLRCFDLLSWASAQLSSALLSSLS